jgi:hypothetical protein
MKLDAKSLRLKISKYHFRKISVQILDFRVSCHSIIPNDEHAQDMTNFPEPGNGQYFLQFLGMLPPFTRR